MIEDTISTAQARRIYDRLGGRYDWFGIFESNARELALALLDVEPGQRVLNVGVGTGQDQIWICQAMEGRGLAVGVDISRVMVRLAADRSRTPMVQADVRHLPFSAATFDVLYVAYLLDLIPAAHQTSMLEGFRRALKPHGRLVALSLTEGVDPPSRVLVALWKALYALSPVLCAGCRPVRLGSIIEHAGFAVERREEVVQWGLPSEIVVAHPGPF